MTFAYYRDAFAETTREILLSTPKQLPYLVTGLDDSARAMVVAHLFQSQPRPMLIVEPNQQKLLDLQNDLQRLLGAEVPVYPFPVEESFAVEYAIASFDHRMERLAALNLLESEQPGIVLTSVAGMTKRLTPIQRWRDAHQTLEVGQAYLRQSIEVQLNDLGYQRQKMVSNPGDYSIRGGIVDFFPLDQDYPIRLDFFDEELDSIRYFDPVNQASIDNLERVSLGPAQDVLFTAEDQAALLKPFQKAYRQALNRIKDPEMKEAFRKGADHQGELLKQGQELALPLAYYEWVDPAGTTLLDYLGPETWLIVSELGKINQIQDRMLKENHFWQEQEIQKGHLFPSMTIALDAYQRIRTYQGPAVHFALMNKNYGKLSFRGIHNFHYRGLTPFYNQMDLLKPELDHWLHRHYVVQLMVGDEPELRQTVQRLEDNHIQPVVIQPKEGLQSGAVNVTIGSVAKGFELPLAAYTVLTPLELFNQRRYRRVQPKHLTNAERIKAYNELNEGDYVVHIAHGIGIYRGIETLMVGSIHKDLLVIEYQDQARVMIPVEQIDLLQKYVGSEHKQPKIHKLGGTEWVKTKQKVRASVEDIADELIELYSQRQALKGYAFSPDTPEQNEFEEAFGYVETEDQLVSTQEIKADMEKAKPMDRLLVGDVGYGKTEVAMRAIFKAVMDGKQVAFLVPTTILAQQHYNTLVERFQAWPFEIGLLSRFVSQPHQKDTLKKIKNGAVSIVIGTHRLLSKDVHFNDLGLLIVDEEQRFGVKHKERLKQLKSQVDVLTLTATPIPRTLHMSMIGIRDLSLIETPPNNRFPVQTYVMEQNEGAIKSAIERELERGGQVFYLHNRVATIYKRAMELETLIPEARIAVAHGQMNESELEMVLMDFISGSYDILVTTTIIETGVDIPNANTLFIEDAEKMGLAALYQLRGRVGRTHRVAYAYFMYSPFKQLSEVSEKRLYAIREFTELGSGFKIAMRDLAIRGAGNLLGQQQSGFIDSVGYDMYSEMLKEAVECRQGKRKPSKAVIDREAGLDWNVNLEAYLPADYIEDESQKIQIYQAIRKITSMETYRDMQDVLIDRFGPYPDEVAHLLDVSLIRSFAAEVGLRSIEATRRALLLTFSRQASEWLKGPTVFQVLQDVPFKAQVQLENQQLKITLDIFKTPPDQWLSGLLTLVREARKLRKEGE